MISSRLFIVIFAVISLDIQGQNPLVNREFWKTKPSLQTVQEKVSEGNSPSALNRFAFDPLTWALIEDAPMSVLKYLFSQEGNSANKLTHDGRTYIFWAAYRDNLEFMKFLIENGAQTDIIDDHGNTLLNFAATTGQSNPLLFDFIIKHGANVKEEKNDDGASPLLLIMPHIENNNMVDYFTERGLSIHDVDDHGSSAVYYAARGGHLPIIKWCINEGVVYKGANKQGKTPMHFASQGERRHSNSVEIFDYLKSQGVPANSSDLENTTPLMLYCNSGNDPQVVKWFLENGASCDQVDKQGNSALTIAAKRQSVECLKELAHNNNAINAANIKGETALLNAISQNEAPSVELLLGSGASVEISTKDGNTALHYWIQSYSSPEVADFDLKETLLKKHGFDPSLTQPNGNTIFHLAAEKNDFTLLKRVSRYKVNINARNKEGLTALHIAAMKTEDLQTLKYLVELGADPRLVTEFEETTFQLAQENELLKAKGSELSFLNN